MWAPKLTNRKSNGDRFRRKRQALFDGQKAVCCWDEKGCLYPGTPMLLLETGPGRPHHLFATFEHVVPRREGGTHANGNVRLAHRGCNEAREQPRFRNRFTVKGEEADGQPVSGV
jgi:5-methylcytosine-specific restriction endonuclease McrA